MVDEDNAPRRTIIRANEFHIPSDLTSDEIYYQMPSAVVQTNHHSANLPKNNANNSFTFHQSYSDNRRQIHRQRKQQLQANLAAAASHWYGTAIAPMPIIPGAARHPQLSRRQLLLNSQMAAGGGPPAYKMQQQHATNNAYGQPPQQQRQSRSSKVDEMLKKIPKVLRDEYIVEHEKPLGKGSFGAIFVASHSSGTKYAVKFENIPSEGNKPVLFYDQQFLGFLSVQHGCRYIPRFIDYGTTDFYHFLIMELCGPSIMDLFKASPKSYLSIPTVTILGMGMLTALHAVHELKIIHRDIKPDNFVLGTSSDPTKILMIDFGLSKQYISMGKHIKIRGNKDLTGTARYVSINTHAGLEQSRRDDLEALSYVLTYLFKGGRLPWIGIQVTDRHLHFKKICEIKESIDLNTLCEGCPEEMVPFISYCRGLPFQLDPNYQYLCELLLQISFRLNFSLDEKKYDWDMDPIFQRKIYSELERINYFGRNHSHQSGFNGNPYLH